MPKSTSLNVCFLLLHPTDAADLLRSTAVIRWLEKQVEGSEVLSVAPSSLSWILEARKPDRLLTYDRNPLDVRSAIRELLPDYLIDLEGGRHYKRLKSKLKILDFPPGKLSLFDVADDQAGPLFSAPDRDPAWLPESFREGYLLLALDSSAGQRELTEDQLVTLATGIEYPLVLTGNPAERPLADEIARRAGCTVYPACGDFTRLQFASMIKGSVGVLTFDPVWKLIAEVFSKPVIFLSDCKSTPFKGDAASIAGLVRQWIKKSG